MIGKWINIQPNSRIPLFTLKLLAKLSNKLFINAHKSLEILEFKINNIHK